MNRDRTYTVLKASRARAAKLAAQHSEIDPLDGNQPGAQYLIERLLGNCAEPAERPEDAPEITHDSYPNKHEVAKVTQYRLQQNPATEHILQPTVSKHAPVVSSSRLAPPGQDDNVSESGTYTIDVSEEVDDARKSIDTVFGVSGCHDTELRVDIEQDQLTDDDTTEMPEEVADDVQSNHTYPVTRDSPPPEVCTRVIACSPFY